MQILLNYSLSVVNYFETKSTGLSNHSYVMFISLKSNWMDELHTTVLQQICALAGKALEVTLFGCLMSYKDMFQIWYSYVDL